MKNLTELEIFLMIFSIFTINKLSGTQIGNMKCYTDCHTASYTGIRSADKNGDKCNKWSSTNHKLRSNYCTMENAKNTWCFVLSNWHFCNIPECASIKRMPGCVSNIQTFLTSSSITGSWSTPKETFGSNIIGYLIVLHDSKGDCLQCIIQIEGMYNLTNTVKNFYISCEKGNIQKNITYLFQFDKLRQNTLYSVYILPVIDEKNVGSVLNVTVSTKLAKPRTVTGVKLNGEEEQNKLKFTWNASKKEKNYGDASSYKLKMTIPNEESVWRETSLTSYEFDKLRECTKYCLRVSAENKAGKADLSEEVCAVTKSPALGEVIVHKIEYGYGRSKDISWQYKGSDNCPKRYKVEYRLQRSETYKTVWTNVSHVLVTNLTPNKMYVLRVSAIGLVHSVDNRNTSSVSQPVKMYTGNVQILVNNYTYSINNSQLTLNWQLKQEDREVVNKFVVVLRNITGNCIKKFVIAILHNSLTGSVNNSSSDEILNCTRVKTINSINVSKDNSYFLEMALNDSFMSFNVLEFYVQHTLGHSILQHINLVKPTDIHFRLHLMWIVYVSITIVTLSILFYCFIKIGIIDSNNKRYQHTIPVTKFSAYVQQINLMNNPFQDQYKNLADESLNQKNQYGLSRIVGMSGVNATKNRFMNIVPYDQSRVLLTSPCYLFNYINASWIPYLDGSKCRAYIAAQSPVKETINDFWLMVWQQNVTQIIGFSSATENKRPAVEYCPKRIGETVAYGTIKVTLSDKDDKSTLIEKKLSLTDGSTGTSRNVTNWQMIRETDDMATNIQLFDMLINRFYDLVNVSRDDQYLVLVHCSTGIACTGVFLCIDSVIREVQNGAKYVDVYQTVLNLRRYRFMMVQTIVQYQFIHHYLAHYLDRKLQRG